MLEVLMETHPGHCERREESEKCDEELHDCGACMMNDIDAKG